MRNFIGRGNTTWFIGVVEDVNDPIQLGRVRVRCFGWHTEDKGQIPTEMLPWAVPINPVTGASASGIGSTPTGLLTGSWVFGIFLDGERAQEPAVLGSLAGVPTDAPNYQLGFTDPAEDLPRYLNESDVNRLARGTNTKTHTTDNVIGEPAEPYAAQYPFNKVFETESGHYKEWDDTPSAERIREGHRSGTQYEIHPNGDKVVKVVGDGYEIVAGRKHVRVGGNCKLIVDGSLDISVGSECLIQSGGNMTFRAPRIDLNPGGGYAPTSSIYVDPPVPYEKNIIEPSVVPTDHPANPEQVEGAQNYPQRAPANCGEVPQANPYDIAASLEAEGGWAETGSNPKITQLWDEIGYNGSQFADQTAWCAVFVGAVLKRSGNKYIQTASSQAYASYGREVQLNDIQRGDIVVFYRDGQSSGLGHVGFATGDYNSETIEVLGGNQGNTLSVRSYRRQRGTDWGIRTIRRAVSCSDDSVTAPPSGSTREIASSGSGGQVT
jgi:uncharacterized protein (TIGR02594 family)